MVVNTLKISFCADHSWREGARESSGERRGKGGGKRRGRGAFKKIDITHKRGKDRRRRPRSLFLSVSAIRVTSVSDIIICQI